MFPSRSDSTARDVPVLPRYRRLQRRAIALFLVALCVMVSLFGWLLTGQYQQEIRAAEARATARSNVMTEWAKGIFGQSGQALFTLAQHVETRGFESAEGMADIQRSVEALTRYMPLINELGILNAQGRVWISSSDNRHAGIDISHTAFFRSFQQGEQRELVTPLYWSEEDAQFYLYHARRISGENDRFEGIVVARLVPQTLMDALQQMRVYDGESMSLVDGTLKLIARHPAPAKPAVVGTQINDPATQQWLTTQQASQTFTARSPLDGRERLFHMQRVGRYPVLVVVGVDVQRQLAGWRQRGLVLTVVMAVMVLLGAWGGRHYLNRLGLSYRLQSREARLDALINSLQDLIFVFDGKGRFRFIHAIEKDKLLLGSQQALGRHYQEVLPAALAATFDTVFHQVQRSGQVATFEYPLMLGQQQRYFHATVSPLASNTHHVEGVLSVTRDITEAKQAEVELQIAAAAFQAHLGIMVTDARGNILKVNDTFKRITGYSDEEVVGKNPRMFSSGHHNAAFYRRLWRSVLATGNWEGEIWNQRKNGELFPEWLTISAVYGATGELTHYVATMSDISERKAAEQEIHQLAFYDPLTGFANRRLFMDRVGTALKELNRHQRCGALLLIDIDNFNHVNDTLGHHAGDQLLQCVARRFGQMLRDTDTLARLGSDEFAVLIEGVDGSPRQTQTLAEHIARKLLAALDEPVAIGEESAVVTASVGITIVSDSQRSADDYLQQVDMALSQAKMSGRHALRFFDPSMQASLLAKVKLEAELRQALENDQWRLHYQPQVDRHGTLTGVEALLRWQHPERGMVSPGEFIPLLESTGLINDVGEWVLEEACQQLARWAPSPLLSQLTISVNISPLQFREADFLARLEQVFQRTQAPLAQLKLEVTESLFVEARDDARDKMLSLKALGVRFSLDDFGTGYSSLAYLAQLPLDQLKIDQSFVQQVLESKANAAIVESTIALAKSLNLDIIAEGVEAPAQQAWLMAHGCHAFQGYLFGRPAPVGEIEAMVSAHSRS
ncbi:EAL domain-containing protein [Halomonas meridiana]|uniref:bifunctional diguanylate cyclase/phosphodiesterase n=1 Tax=Vreelandella aquamarina TaxID=77097 RepID=UPI00273B1C06|nr:EAL domain-containing protein [Halomonas meridiana]MDP4558500.1 EAL domain-containing protein [Halomonas meridiana]